MEHTISETLRKRVRLEFQIELIWAGSEEDLGEIPGGIWAGIWGGSGQGSGRELKKTSSSLGDQMSKSAALAPCSPKRGYNYVIYGGGPEPVLSKS